MVRGAEIEPGHNGGKQGKPLPLVEPKIITGSSTAVSEKLPTTLKEATIFQSPEKRSFLKRFEDLFSQLAYENLDLRTEQNPTKSPTIAKKTLREKISKWADAAGPWIFRSLALHQIVRHIKPEYAAGFEDKFTEIMKDPNVVPILLSNHQGWADGITMALTSKKLTRMINKARGFDDDRVLQIIKDDLKAAFAGNMLQKRGPNKERFTGFVLTITRSLEADGKNQGPFIKELTKQVQPWFHDHFLTTDAFVREKDVEKYGLSKTINRAHNLRMSQDIKGGTRGRALFPEASVESGRLSEEGKNGNHNSIKGMQNFDTSIEFDGLLRHMQKAGKKGVFIVEGSHGASRIIDPNQKKPDTEICIPIPTWRAWMHNLNPLNIYVINDFIKAFSKLAADIEIKGLMEIKIGMPILADDMIKEIMKNRRDQSLNGQNPTSEEIANYLGKKTAMLIPEKERGDYA